MKSFFNNLNKNTTSKITSNDKDYLITLNIIPLAQKKNPSKVSDYQNNSIIFIDNLIKDVASNTQIKFELNLKDSIKNFNIFIVITNKLIDKYFKIDTIPDDKYKYYILIFFLYFLFFMNFRLGQFFLYYVFFEFKKISISLSETFQNLIKQYMNFSTFDLKNLCNTSDDKILIGFTNSKISFGKLQSPNYYFMDEFKPALNLNNSTSTTPTTKSNKTNDLVSVTDSAKENADNAQKQADDENQQANDAANDAKQSETDANHEANEAKEFADNAKIQAASAKQKYENNQTEYNTIQTEYVKENHNTTTTPVNHTIKEIKQRLDAAFIELEESKKQVTDAFIATQKAKIRITKAIENLLITNINNQTKAQDNKCAQKILDNANSNQTNIVNISNQLNNVVIDLKTAIADSTDGDYNNTLKTLLPIDDQDPINVQSIVETMNRLSFEIAKKYCQDTLTKTTRPTTPTTGAATTGGNQKYKNNKTIKKTKAYKKKYSIRRRLRFKTQ
jgi:hypothetical protein